jgi:hypothetical protein
MFNMTKYPVPSRFVVDPMGDIDIVIQDYRFVVSSLRMSIISPIFRGFFSNQSLKVVELPNENPVAFHLICQSAHGQFIPQSYISLDVLYDLADAIERYDIPNTCAIHETVQFCFDVRARLPGTMTSSDLTALLRVARTLGPTVLVRFLDDTFFLRPFYFEALPIESDLRHLRLQGAACRFKVARILLASTMDTVHLQQEMYELATMIVMKGHSLYQISARLDQIIKNSLEHQSHHLKNAHDAIGQAAAGVTLHFRQESKLEIANKDGNFPQRPLALRSSHRVDRLEVQIACEEQAVDPIPSPNTEFEDIDVYSQSADEHDETNLQSGHTTYGRSKGGAFIKRRNTA